MSGAGQATDDKNSAFQSASCLNLNEPSPISSSALTMQATTSTNETSAPPNSDSIPTISNQISQRDSTIPTTRRMTTTLIVPAAAANQTRTASSLHSLFNSRSSTAPANNGEELPPAYETIVNENPIGPPPSYDALFSRLKYVHRAQEKGLLVPSKLP